MDVRETHNKVSIKTNSISLCIYILFVLTFFLHFCNVSGVDRIQDSILTSNGHALILDRDTRRLLFFYVLFRRSRKHSKANAKHESFQCGMSYRSYLTNLLQHVETGFLFDVSTASQGVTNTLPNTTTAKTWTTSHCQT
jgi:hypothetical protein